MPMTCVAYGCNNHFVKGCGKQFFRFPMKDPDRLSKWVLAIRRKNWKPSASSRICSDHFTENDYMLRPGAMVPRLRLDAVPSIFDGFPNHLKERLEKKKIFHKMIEEKIVNQHGTPDAAKTTVGSMEPKDTSTSCQNSESMQVQKLSPLEIKQETSKKQDEKNKVDKVKTCAVPGCHNSYYSGCQQLFFRFPVNDPELLSKWLVVMHHENNSSITAGSICSDHFTEKDYVSYPGATVPQLGPDAVPSLIIKLPTEIQAEEEFQNTQQVDCTENSVLTEQAKDQISISTETRKPKLHEISNKKSVSEQKQQVKHGPLVQSRAVTCVVHGCNSIFVKGCGKRFFRFPMKNPDCLSKWIKALQYPNWKPSASSRICSDHFKDEDYILPPGTLVPRLCLSAVPSVFKARKSRRKQIATTDQNLGHCKSIAVVDGFQEAELNRPCDHTYSAVYSVEDLPRFNPDTVKLKRKVRTLQRQIQRQRHTIKKLSERITQLKSNSS